RELLRTAVCGPWQHRSDCWPAGRSEDMGGDYQHPLLSPGPGRRIGAVPAIATLQPNAIVELPFIFNDTAVRQSRNVGKGKMCFRAGAENAASRASFRATGPCLAIAGLSHRRGAYGLLRGPIAVGPDSQFLLATLETVFEAPELSA